MQLRKISVALIHLLFQIYCVICFSCVNEFIETRADALMSNIDLFLQNLFRLADDADSDVRKHVCHALVMLVQAQIEQVEPHIHEILRYMLSTSQDGDETVALEAGEFWLMITDQPMCRTLLQSYLDKLLPILVKNMKYSEMDAIILQDNIDDDQGVPDRLEDIRPRFHRTKTKHHGPSNVDDDNPTYGLTNNLDTNNNATTLTRENAQPEENMYDGGDDDDDGGWS